MFLALAKMAGFQCPSAFVTSHRGDGSMAKDHASISGPKVAASSPDPKHQDCDLQGLMSFPMIINVYLALYGVPSSGDDEAKIQL